MAALVVTALAGCGGSGAGPSRAAFVKQADAICAPTVLRLRGVSAQISKVAAGTDPGPIFAKSAVLIRRSRQITAQALDQLDGLDQPAADRDALKGWLADNRSQNALAGGLATAFAAEDQKRISLLSEEIDRLNTKNSAFAQRFGMKACADRL